MIGCISPASSSADHSLNTLRYADRLKGKKIEADLNDSIVKSDEEEMVEKKSDKIPSD